MLLFTFFFAISTTNSRKLKFSPCKPKKPKQIYDDLRFDIFPRFIRSEYYRNYIHLKNLETKPVNINDFEPRFTLGNGAFGHVNAARKKNTGRMYAIKFLSKKQVVASEQINAVLNEQMFLSMMNSPFVTGLKYSFTDKEYLYLVFFIFPVRFTATEFKCVSVRVRDIWEY